MATYMNYGMKKIINTPKNCIRMGFISQQLKIRRWFKPLTLYMKNSTQSVSVISAKHKVKNNNNNNNKGNYFWMEFLLYQATENGYEI
jgi:hypothetical protein